MNVLVVGAGEMGQWFARTLDEHAAASLDFAFADTDSAVARTATATVGGRAVSPDTTERFDLVCVAVPMPVTVDAIETYASNAKRAICDVAGIMADPVAAMTDHAPDCERVSFHPLFAPANAPGNVPLVADESGPVTDQVRDALAAAGNDLFETTSEEHDAAMETVQARTHAAILAFGLAGESVPDRFQTPISAGLFDLLETVTGGEARVYADIQAAFEGSEDVAAAAERLADADDETFEALYRAARPDEGTDE
ncbi:MULTISPECIES: prephenate dehydrogenase/arogenate dehydrogenase family protein [unclassified Halorhabdus]|uniref:prephenate dehydrogenase/arogenate dehydrogenase family protein n=1 Tax=unclassified Halorhabdus TaxID=2621901 RepID=UPI0023D9FD87|nr:MULTISPECIES: prephenate dehydrogenase/arogenate dehydrogenase family protein [unclassified Halorhabdus]WEL17482.1 Prephenate dehydrogenase [Halorhabdus sp. SVX81]WEL21360.1 Prephenate dehydrogenase [Halorhabdus sp. BNX81]